jgi:glycosyltransferase involved in cell wall biosynthesis
MYPKITAVIPNYNHELYLKKRIDSVIQQSYKNIEIIILDDCSTDNSRDIIESYRENELVTQIIYNTKNSGSPFAQWKKGAELGTGDWVWFAESDDYADPCFIETLIGEVLNDNSVGLIYCDSKIIAEDKIYPYTFADIKNKNFNTNRWSQNHKNNGLNEIEQFLFKGGTINNSSAVLFDRKLLLEANPFDLPLKLIGDKYAFLKVLAKKNIAYCKEPLNYYRNPFNVKNNQLFYIYEHFLVSSWVYRTIYFKDFFQQFYTLTSFSLFRNWNTLKIKIYISLLVKNPFLFFLHLNYNFFRPFRKK